MPSPRVPPAARPALDAWLDPVATTLGPRLGAILLYGGAALDDFAPRWSDLDVCVVLTERLRPEDEAALREIQAETHERFAVRREQGWASSQYVEGPFILTDLAADPVGRGEAWMAQGDTLERASRAKLQPFDRYQIAHFGLRLRGDDVRVAPPPREALLAQLRHDLDTVEMPRLERPVWLAGTLQGFARSLLFWRDGLFLTKTAALEREIAAGSPFAEAFALALRLRKEGAEACAAHHAALKRQFEETAPRVVELLAPLAGP